MSHPSRTQRDGPWAWFDKASMNKIRVRCEAAPSCMAVYLALCELASDEQSPSFCVTLRSIMAKSGLSRRTVLARLHDLEFIGLVEITRQFQAGEQQPSAYRLLRCQFRGYLDKGGSATIAPPSARKVTHPLHPLGKE